MILTLLASCALYNPVLPLTSLLVPQEEGLTPAHSPFQQSSEQTVEYYTPQKASVRELSVVMQQLYGGPYPITVPPPTFYTFGETLLVSARKEVIEQVLATVERTDLQYVGGGERPTAPTEIFQYKVRHISFDAVRSALQSFDNSMRPMRQGERMNLRYIEERKVVIYRGSAEEVVQVKQVLSELDVPQPSLLISCFLVHGSGDMESSSQVPADLARDLSALVPFKGFSMLSSATVLTDANAPVTVSADVDLDRGEFMLRLRPGAYDPATGALNLASVDFQMSFHDDQGSPKKRNFSTSCTLKTGRYAVLGSVGADADFVVLKMTAIE